MSKAKELLALTEADNVDKMRKELDKLEGQLRKMKPSQPGYQQIQKDCNKLILKIRAKKK